MSRRLKADSETPHIEERFLHFTGNQRRNEARSTRTIDERKRESLGGVYLSYFSVISEKFSVGNFIEILLLIIVDL